jgi:hypothetical protein
MSPADPRRGSEERAVKFYPKSESAGKSITAVPRIPLYGRYAVSQPPEIVA